MTMPNDSITAAVMVGLIVLSAVSAVGAARRIRGKQQSESGRPAPTLVIAVVLVALAGLIYRMASVHGTWAPLRSHADGVLLMVGLISGIVVYTQAVGRLRGLELFAMPTTAILAGWGLCSTWWTFDQSQFTIRTAWSAVHITTVYFGLAAVAITAICGGLYLFVQRQLKRRDNPADRIRILGRTASLETIDRWLIGWGTVAFIMLTAIGILGGIDASAGESSLGEQWWLSGKFIGAVIGWLIFAALCHVRIAPQFRGRRAALLALVGFVTILTVTAVAFISAGARGSGHSPPDNSQVDQD
jgi:ABC-type transport system involved in cytochrome c biogenesis permease subunit